LDDKYRLPTIEVSDDARLALATRLLRRVHRRSRPRRQNRPTCAVSEGVNQSPPTADLKSISLICCPRLQSGVIREAPPPESELL